MMKQTLKTGLKKVCILLRAVKMHFMIGRIFMNQESKVINVHLEKRENKDYLVFGFEEVAEVCLNDDESQNNLKSIFVKGRLNFSLNSFIKFIFSLDAFSTSFAPSNKMLYAFLFASLIMSSALTFKTS